MKVQISPSIVKGIVSAPASKSYSHRAIIIASLAKGRSNIGNVLFCEDTLLTIRALQDLGVSIKKSGNSLSIEGVNGIFKTKDKIVNIFCGNSGTTARFLISLCALNKGKVIIDGSQRLRERPFKELIYALSSQRINISSKSPKTSLPVLIEGRPLKGGKIKISGMVSSQFISSLLVISPYAANNIDLEVDNLISAPYVDITLEIMKKFGNIVKKIDRHFFVLANHKYKATDYYVEGDYSSASYFFAAAAICNSQVTVQKLNPDSKQGDKYFLTLLKNMGSKVSVNGNNMTVSGKTLNGIRADMGNFPDLVPTLSVVAAYAHGKTIIKNIRHLRQKESDRISAVCENLRNMGIEVIETLDTITITGGKPKAAEINPYNDHRIAMSFSIAALSCSGITTINDADCIEKSYPAFWENLQKIGGKINYL